MRSVEEPDLTAENTERPKPLAGYPAEGKAALDQRTAGTKLNRHKTRILPTPIALRGEYNKLARNPKCGRRGAIGVLAKKYKVSQKTVIKTLKKKANQV